MNIDFKQEVMTPGSPNFQKNDVTLTTFDKDGAQVNPDGIDPAKGFISAYLTKCDLPESNPVTLSLLVVQAVTVTGYDATGPVASHDYMGPDDIVDVPFTVDVTRVEIVAQDRNMVEAYVQGLAWTPKKKDSAKGYAQAKKE